MALNSLKNKILSRPVAAYLLQDKSATPASTTLANAAAIGATTVTLTSGTGFTTGKPFRIGAGEFTEPCQVASVAGAVVTLARPLRQAHEALEPVIEYTAYDLGALGGAAGLQFNGESTDFEVETSRLAFATLNGFIDIGAFCTMVGVTPANFAVGLGIPMGKVRGASSLADPLELTTDGSEIGSAVNQSVIVHGVKNDGTPVVVECWGAENDYTGFQVAFARGQAVTIPARWLGGFGLYDENAPFWVGDTAMRPSKGDLLDGIREIGIWIPATTGPLSTTLSSSAAADQKNIAMTSSTNLTAQDWVKIGTGDRAEYHRVQTLGTPNVLATRLYRAHASGTPVVRMQKVSLGAIVKGSTSFSVGGSVEKIQVENSRTTLGLKAGSATPTLAFQIAQLTGSTLAYALAAAQGDFAGDRMNIGENVGVAPIDGLYLEGRNQNQQTVLLGLWGCSQAITELLISMQKAGINGLNFSVRPGSAFTLNVHA
jgi:hypothetical protein